MIFLFALLVAATVYLVVREHAAEKRATALRTAGLAVMVTSMLVFGVFVVAGTFGDPGGWRALALVCAWAIPLAVLAAIAWFRPDQAIWVFSVLVVLLIGVSIWFALNPEGWQDLEDRNGPILDVMTFVVSTAIALLGVKRTREAGSMLLVLGIVGPAIASLGSLDALGPLFLTAAPIITGTLYLVSSTMSTRSAGLTTRDDDRRVRGPGADGTPSTGFIGP